MAENSERQRQAADDIMDLACLPEAMVVNGLDKAIRDAIIAALEREHTEGWNAAMGGGK